MEKYLNLWWYYSTAFSGLHDLELVLFFTFGSSSWKHLHRQCSLPDNRELLSAGGQHVYGRSVMSSHKWSQNNSQEEEAGPGSALWPNTHPAHGRANVLDSVNKKAFWGCNAAGSDFACSVSDREGMTVWTSGFSITGDQQHEIFHLTCIQPLRFTPVFWKLDSARTLLKAPWQQRHGTIGTSAACKPKSCWPMLGEMAASWWGTANLCLEPMPCVCCKYNTLMLEYTTRLLPRFAVWRVDTSCQNSEPVCRLWAIGVDKKSCSVG